MHRPEFIAAGKVIPFPSERFVVGSAPDAGVRLLTPGIAPKHVEVFSEADGTWWARDLTGSGAMRVDGISTLEGQLMGGSFLLVGPIELSVRAGGDTGSGTLMTESGENASLGATSSQRPRVGPAASAQPKARLEPGDNIGDRYRIVRRLAAGGMGEVYEAQHIELQKPVAVKVMLPELSKDSDFVARFKREAIAASRIGQHNIVDISDFGRTAEGRFYFVMELLDGRTLASHLREGALPTRRAVNIILQIARALMAAHDMGIVHRDLKPENVMLLQRPGTPDFVKVLDFGIAKVNEGHGSGGLTQFGMVVGTPQYMSPEQAAGTPVDTRSDIYSLGLIFYEALAGRPTFVGETPSVLMAKQIATAPPPLAPGPLEMPLEPKLEQLVFHMLAKKPEARPQSMHDVVEWLESMYATATGSMLPTGRTSGSISTIQPLAVTPPGGTVRDSASVTPRPMASGSATGSQAVTGGSSSRPATGTNSVPGGPSVSSEVAAAFASTTGSQPAAPPSRSRTVWVLMACGILGLLGAVGVLKLIEPSAAPVVVAPPPVQQPVPEAPPQPKETPPPQPPAPSTVSYAFDTTPSGAELYDGEVLLGTTPMKVSREKGTTLSLRFQLKGHKPLLKKVRFEETDGSLRFELEREKKGGSGPGKKSTGPGDEPFSNVRELKDLPD